MRLFIGCEERLGICAEILDILVKHSIDLRGIEIETPGGIFLNFPTVEFAEFQHLMPEIRLIRGVFDVSLVPYMPLEREQQEMRTLLRTLPEPVISIDTRGQVVIANEAALDILQLPEQDVRRKMLRNWVKGFNFTKWLNSAAPSSESVHLQLKGRTFLADIYPVHILKDDDNSLFTGAVIAFKSPERLGRQLFRSS